MGETMKTTVSGSNGLETREVPTPDPVGDEVLVRVISSGVNRADVMQADRGPSAETLGLEFSGIVETLGSRCDELVEGQQVMGLVPLGGHSTHVILPESHCVPIPAGISPEDAGAIPEVFVTAWDALVQAGVRPGDRVLVNGVGSGVGTAAVQLIRLFGATSVGTSRTPRKLELAGDLGLDEGVLIENGHELPVVAGVDVVLELLGGRYLQWDLESANPRARIVVIGRVAGPTAEVDVGTIMYKRLQLIGTAMRPRSLAEKTELMRRFHHELSGHFSSGALAPVCDRRFPLDQASAAYAAVRDNEVFGKVLLLP
jgi:NADPH:quinone reductase-like Zn-dependent oxidoreductase